MALDSYPVLSISHVTFNDLQIVGVDPILEHDAIPPALVLKHLCILGRDLDGRCGVYAHSILEALPFAQVVALLCYIAICAHSSSMVGPGHYPWEEPTLAPGSPSHLSFSKRPSTLRAYLRVQSTSPTHYVARNVRCNFFFNPLNTLAVYRNSATARLLVTVVYMYTMACT